MLPQTVRNANVDLIILVLDPERKARPECPPGIGGGRVAHAARGSAPTTGPGKSSPFREEKRLETSNKINGLQNNPNTLSKLSYK